MAADLHYAFGLEQDILRMKKIAEMTIDNALAAANMVLDALDTCCSRVRHAAAKLEIQYGKVADDMVHSADVAAQQMTVLARLGNVIAADLSDRMLMLHCTPTVQCLTIVVGGDVQELFQIATTFPVVDGCEIFFVEKGKWQAVKIQFTEPTCVNPAAFHVQDEMDRPVHYKNLCVHAEGIDLDIEFDVVWNRLVAVDYFVHWSCIRKDVFLCYE